MAGSARGNKGSRVLAALWKGEAPLPCAAIGVIGQVASRCQFETLGIKPLASLKKRLDFDSVVSVMVSRGSEQKQQLGAFFFAFFNSQLAVRKGRF